MTAEGDGGVQQYYAIILRDKSAGAAWIRRAKGAAVVRLLRSVRCEDAVIRCDEPEDSFWLESVLSEAGLNVASNDNLPGPPGVSGNQVAGPSQIHVIAGGTRYSASADSGNLLINLDVPDEATYLQSVREGGPSSPSRAVVTYVTPLELVDLKGYTQEGPETKIKPLPEALPGFQHVDNKDNQRSSAQPLSSTDAPAVAAGSMDTEPALCNSTEAEHEPTELQSQAEILQRKKEQLLRAIDALNSHQNGSSAAEPSAIPTAQNGSQNGLGADAVNLVSTEAADEEEVPPAPLGSPSAAQAATAAGSGAFREAASALHEEMSNKGSGPGQDASPGAILASPEGAGRRGRQRSAQEAAARKEQQQERALERAILEIHWQQAEYEEDVDFEEAGELDNDVELGEGELPEGVSMAEDQPAAAPNAGPAWYEHLPQFYQQWGRSTAGATPSSTGGKAANEGAGEGEESSAQAAAWEDWYQQQGYGEQHAPALQGGAASTDKSGEDLWQQWNTWQQQQGSWAGSVPDWSSWNAAGQAVGSSAGPFSWAAGGGQGPGQEGFVSVPVALLQRYQMLEWAEWCRQYERWQASYEQWYSWWSSLMWQASGCYGASTGQDASAS